MVFLYFFFAGNKVEKLCDLCNITVNKNAVFGDSSALAPGGVRIGEFYLLSMKCFLFLSMQHSHLHLKKKEDYLYMRYL